MGFVPLVTAQLFSVPLASAKLAVTVYWNTGALVRLSKMELGNQQLELPTGRVAAATSRVPSSVLRISFAPGVSCTACVMVPPTQKRGVASGTQLTVML